jgi:hypothetical protein
MNSNVPWHRLMTLLTKCGSLGRSGNWKSLTLSRHPSAAAHADAGRQLLRSSEDDDELLARAASV